MTLWRSAIYEIWGFDAAFNKHWIFLWQMWQDGWVIDTLSEWLFFLAIFLFIPLWLLGWLTFAQIKWGSLILKGLKYAYTRLRRAHKKYFEQKVLVITRKKSYRRIRPPALTYVMPIASKPKKRKKRKDGKDDSKMRDKIDVLSGKKSSKKKKKKTNLMAEMERYTGTSEMPEIDDDEVNSPEIENLYNSRRNDVVPPWDTTPEEKPEPEPMTAEERDNMLSKAMDEAKEFIKANGFEVFENVAAGDINIGIIGISGDTLLSCMIDRDEGDWLADEESFNEEDPLWFSEKTHRISPVKLLADATEEVRKKLGLGDDIAIQKVLAIEGGNVINASDMAETWENLGVKVCRVAGGAPVTLPNIVEVLPKAKKKATKGFSDECKKILKKSSKD